MLPLGEDLVMAVNRDGFLWTRRQEREAADPAREGIALYRTEDPLWREYSAASLFRFGDRAAVLLYRDDFFADSAVPLPDPRIRVLDREEGRSLGAELPALAGLDAASGWDVEALRPGRDGRWYYRAVNKGSGAAPVIRYYASESLDLPGEAVETGRFRDSALPEIPGVEPLRSLLKALSGPSGGSAALVSPAFAASRRFLLGRDWSGGAPEAAGEDLQGYYREEGNGHFRAVLIRPGGRGLAGAGLSSGAGTDWRLRDLSLPPLPENFVYTGAGLSGDTLFASWEEQEDYNIGAAGFMAIRLRLEP
jgi:hypothetical protein